MVIYIITIIICIIITTITMDVMHKILQETWLHLLES
jgi:hypothetical protein